jgi:hypothetical protein
MCERSFHGVDMPFRDRAEAGRRSPVAARLTAYANRWKRGEKSRLVCVDDGGRAIGIISLSDIAQHEDRARVGALLCNITRREAHASAPAPL